MVSEASDCTRVVFLGAYTVFQKVNVSFVMAVCLPARNNFAPTGWIFITFGIWVFFKYVSRIVKFH